MPGISCLEFWMFSSFLGKSVNTKKPFIVTGLKFFEDEDIQAILPKEQSDVDHDRSDGACQLKVHGQG